MGAFLTDQERLEEQAIVIVGLQTSVRALQAELKAASLGSPLGAMRENQALRQQVTDLEQKLRERNTDLMKSESHAVSLRARFIQMHARAERLQGFLDAAAKDRAEHVAGLAQRIAELEEQAERRKHDDDLNWEHTRRLTEANDAMKAEILRLQALLDGGRR